MGSFVLLFLKRRELRKCVFAMFALYFVCECVLAQYECLCVCVCVCVWVFFSLLLQLALCAFPFIFILITK